MLSKILSTAALAVALVAVPMTAQAAGSDLYTPTPTDGASLAGSVAVVECAADVPVIRYSVNLTDPNNTVTTDEATLILTSGSNTTTVALGSLVNNRLEGTVLWPGATAENGVATGWPGWQKTNGEWVETSGNFAWTRGSIEAVLYVNSSISVPVSYPEASSTCAAPAGEVATASSSSQPLAATGLDSWVIPTGLGALAVALLGSVVVFSRRTRRVQS